MRGLPRRSAAALIGLGLAAGVAGCATAHEAPASYAATALTRARAVLPDEVRRAGVLRVGSDLTYPPMESTDNGKPVGFDIELVTALATRLGLRVEVAGTDFGKLLSEVGSHGVDVVLSSMTDTAERQRDVDFVDYLNVGSSLVIGPHTADPGGVRGLCGLRVAVEANTMYPDLVRSLSTNCPVWRPIRTVVVGDPGAAVHSGAADAYLDDFPLAVAAIADSPELKVSGSQIEAAPYGIAVAKDRVDLRTAIALALTAMFDDGSYDKLLSKWHLPEGSLKTAAIDGGA
jgi:polar amino acid transport system substrate-binding protein